MYGDRKGSKVMKINFVSSLHRSMSSWHLLTILLLLLSLQLRLALGSFTLFGPAKKAELRDQVRQMFYHAYDNYMQYAFPHDELKPLTKTFTDSLGELGNLKLERLSEQYNGSALTLVESLSSLHVLGNSSEFEKGVLWLGENLTFDVDVRVSLFECNIRLLGGLISAHLLATDLSKKSFREPYKDQLLILANDLGQRFLRAFDTPTGLPYAWINLKHGVMENETTETSTSGCGSLILEMGALSRLTGKPEYEESALRALRKLWSMRSSLDLMGTTLDVTTGEWIEHSSGIGAGVDSFYEYLIKAHILFGRDEYWDMFSSAYTAVQKYFRHGPWYLLDRDMLHPTEKYYPLRPELAESTLFLYQATRDPWYLEVGEAIINSLNVYTRVNGGFASVRDVTTMKLEDHQHSFFLAETCKYLYLLFDDTFLVNGNYVFSTEGHPLPVTHSWHEWIPSIYMESEAFEYKRGGKHVFKSAMSSKLCPVVKVSPVQGKFWVESACHVLDKRSNHKCQSDKECGVDATTCRQRTCSIAGYCGLWLVKF
ncbi:alpha-mannosidase I MNS5 isoform X3 [Cryptomeria japonica]|uniref:alpha-mannosidase I MNS5 isoform X3 n=1 Tax=Cryptomeria japonica TaxID=3369 RepID=UPI0025AD6A78|nr:alpha-mannosidase I MNS5 isoform X3 [Cryptomeria japonica]